MISQSETVFCQQQAFSSVYAVPCSFILTVSSSSVSLFWVYLQGLHYIFMFYLLSFERKLKWCNSLVAAENMRFYMPCEGPLSTNADVLQQDLLLWIPHIFHVEKTGTQA